MNYKVLVTAYILLNISVAVTGCGSSSNNDTPPANNTDTWNWSLSDFSQTPKPGDTEISTSTAIRIFLNKDIDASTLDSGGFTLTGPSPVSGEIIYIPNYHEMKFIPDEPLRPYTLYTAAFTTDLMDVDGLHLESGLSWDFTTGPEIIRVSVDSNGIEGEYSSHRSDINADGSRIAFVSSAANLVADDTNHTDDIFVYNVTTKETVRVSVNTSGTQFLSSSSYPVISGNGRFVAFFSQVYYLHDIQTGITTRIDEPEPLATGTTTYPVIEDYPAISYDGRYVAFQSARSLTPDDTTTLRDIFLRDTVLNTTTLISVSSDEVQGNHHSYSPSISPDGRYVAFTSIANNLVSSDTNGTHDIFVRDVISGTTTRASVAAGGTIGANGESSNPVISADGRYVSFTSEASNLVPNDTNGQRDAFVYDSVSGITRRVSVDSNGAEGNNVSTLSDMSSDGRYIVFSSNSTNWHSDAETLLNQSGISGLIYVHDTVTGNTRRLSTPSYTGGSYPSYNRVSTISADGLFLTFYSDDSYLDGRDNNYTYDVFRLSLSEP